MNLWLRIVNAVLYLAAACLLATGLALEWKVEIEDEGRFLLGLSGEDWGEVHFIIALVVTGLTLAHLVLNWAWIRGVMKNLRAPVIALLAAGVLIVAGVLLAPVSGPGGEAGGPGDGRAAQGDDD